MRNITDIILKFVHRQCTQNTFHSVSKANCFILQVKLILHFLLHQEALWAKSLKMSHVVDTDIQTVNFIRVCVLDHSEFKALL